MDKETKKAYKIMIKWLNVLQSDLESQRKEIKGIVAIQGKLVQAAESTAKIMSNLKKAASGGAG